MNDQLPPRADERSEDLITTHSPKVRHLPMYPNSRLTTVRTKCGKLAWFYRIRRVPRRRLPVCAECQRQSRRNEPMTHPPHADEPYSVPPPAPTEKVAHRFILSFGGWADPDPVCARLFGKLVELAEGTVTEHRSDLYRDAQQLQELMPGLLNEARERGASDFYWAARTHGTVCQRYRNDYTQTVGILGRVFGYRIIIRHRGYTDFEADFVPDTEPYVALPLTKGGEH